MDSEDAVSLRDFTMSNLSRSLFSAILADDRATVTELLPKNPQLSQHATQTEARLASGIAHWVYAGDTALQAAADHRGEIATMMLAVGADPNPAKNHRRNRLRWVRVQNRFVPGCHRK